MRQVTRYVFCNQLINYLLTGYPVRTENTKPAVTSHGPHFVRSVLCDFGLSIFQYGPRNQLLNRYSSPDVLLFLVGTTVGILPGVPKKYRRLINSGTKVFCSNFRISSILNTTYPNLGFEIKIVENIILKFNIQNLTSQILVIFE